RLGDDLERFAQRRLELLRRRDERQRRQAAARGGYETDVSVERELRLLHEPLKEPARLALAHGGEGEVQRRDADVVDGWRAQTELHVALVHVACYRFALGRREPREAERPRQL